MLNSESQLRDLLISHLNMKGWGFHINNEGHIVIPNTLYPEFGDIIICDNIDEMAIWYGRFTRGHYGCYETQLSKHEQHELIIADVLNALERTFTNQMFFFGSQSGGGGCNLIGKPRGILSRLIFGKDEYTWSGKRS